MTQNSSSGENGQMVRSSNHTQGESRARLAPRQLFGGENPKCTRRCSEFQKRAINTELTGTSERKGTEHLC